MAEDVVPEIFLALLKSLTQEPPAAWQHPKTTAGDGKQVARLISEGLDESLSPPERARLRLHVVVCPNCRHVDEQMGFLRQAMRRLGREGMTVVPDPGEP